jgi:hypothetical protein
LAAAAVVRRRCGGFRPVPWGAAELAARQEAVDLVNAQPELWPLLNKLTLRALRDDICGGVDWCDTLRLLQREASPRLPLRAA